MPLNVITKITSGWSKFRDLVPLLANRGFPLGAKGRLNSACVNSIMLYGGETWPNKEEGEIRLEKNYARMVRWICNIRSDKISAEIQPM